MDLISFAGLTSTIVLASIFLVTIALSIYNSGIFTYDTKHWCYFDAYLNSSAANMKW